MGEEEEGEGQVGVEISVLGQLCDRFNGEFSFSGWAGLGWAGLWWN